AVGDDLDLSAGLVAVPDRCRDRCCAGLGNRHDPHVYVREEGLALRLRHAERHAAVFAARRSRRKRRYATTGARSVTTVISRGTAMRMRWPLVPMPRFTCSRQPSSTNVPPSYGVMSRRAVFRRGTNGSAVGPPCGWPASG